MLDTNFVYDIETMVNTSVFCFEDYKSNERKEFVVCHLRNDFNALVEFLMDLKKSRRWLVAFNGLAFDSQILQFIIKDHKRLQELPPERIAAEVYDKAQTIIMVQNDIRSFPEFSERHLSIRHIDVFKLNHWDNAAKRSSLKWIQYSMDWENIQEMPIPHYKPITSWQDLDTVVDYCWNDVSSTKRIMEKSKDQIKLRRDLSKEYNINLYSASEPKISRELFLLFLSEKTGTNKWDLRALRTIRESIKISDILLPAINFSEPLFQGVLDEFKKVVITPLQTKGGFKYSVKHKGVKIDFGLGGIHGARSEGVYEAKEGTTIMTSDVTSFYPNLAIKNKWAPAHLPVKDFCDLYEWFFEERKKIPKKDPRNYVYKIILNSTFGLSIDENSFLYDPQFGMQITVNGQMLLCMLYVMVSTRIPESTLLILNTDGLEIMIPEEKKEAYMEICKEWEDLTKLGLEHDEYSKIVLRDVNNYLAIYKGTAKTKCKGMFEFEDLPLHKNKSHLIVSKGLYEFFVNGTSPEDYLKTNRNIYDYCAGVRIKGDWKFQQTCVIDGQVVYEDLQSTLRYYVSNKGCKIIKACKTDTRQIQLESGKWLQTVFNKYESKNWENYDINEDYYLEAIYNEIENIMPPVSNQLTLF